MNMEDIKSRLLIEDNKSLAHKLVSKKKYAKVSFFEH